MTIKRIILTAIVLGIGHGAWAADQAGRFEDVRSSFYVPGTQRVDIEGGLAIPTGVNHLSTSEKTGPAIGGDYLYQVTDEWGVGARFDYLHLGAKTHMITNDTFGGGFDANSKDSALVLELMGRCNLVPGSRVMPYIHSGLGLNYFHQITDGTPVPNSTWLDTGTAESRRVQDVKSLGFAYSIGLGVETNLTKDLMVGLEGGWQFLGVSKSTYGTSVLSLPIATLRLGWRFGRSSV